MLGAVSIDAIFAAFKADELAEAGDERGAMIDAGNVVEGIVVRIGEDGLVNIFAEDRDEMLRLKTDFLEVRALLHADGGGRDVVGGDEIEGGLQRVEIAGAVGGDGEAGAAGGGAGSFGGESPR